MTAVQVLLRVKRVSELHRNLLNGFATKLRSSASAYSGAHHAGTQLCSKTDHRQIAALASRHIEDVMVMAGQGDFGEGGLKDPNGPYLKLKSALDEAEQLDQIADEMTEVYQKTIKKGNVEFVDNP